MNTAHMNKYYVKKMEIQNPFDDRIPNWHQEIPNNITTYFMIPYRRIL